MLNSAEHLTVQSVYSEKTWNNKIEQQM